MTQPTQSHITHIDVALGVPRKGLTMDDNDLTLTQKNLQRNGFAAYVCENPDEARILFRERILPGLNIQSASYGDSLTLRATGILDEVRQIQGIKFIETFDPAKTGEERIEARRQALGVDLFLTGANAITRGGQIVNLDMIGNRINGIVFGPKAVLLTIGKNKIVPDIAAGMQRIKATSAPANARRHRSFQLPCQETGHCVDCANDQRICNVWSIIEKCYPKGRIRVLLINAELGL